MKPDTSIKRHYYLDNLKIFLTILVIMHHVGQAYGPTGGFWQYHSSLKENTSWLGSFFSVNAGFFMGLFFLIFGYFLPGSYECKGGNTFLKDKLLRFGPPLLLALFIMVPLQMYFYYSLYSGNRPISFLQYYRIIYFGLEGRPDWFQSTIGWPELNFGHLWFVEHLLLYSLIYWLGRKFFSWSPRKALVTPRFWLIILLAFVIASITTIVREWYPIDKWIAILGFIQTEVAHLPQYVLMFFTGILAFRHNWFIGISKRTGYLSLIFGVIMAVGIYTSRVMPVLRPLIYSEYPLYESFMAVFLCWECFSGKI